MSDNVKTKVAVQYHNAEVEFFDEPNNIGRSTNINFKIVAQDKILDATAQVTDGFQSYSLCGNHAQMAAELGVSEDFFSFVFENSAFSLFCQEAVEKAFWSHHQSSPAYDYKFGSDDGCEVLYDCQVAPAYWSPVVLKSGGTICLLAVNNRTEEVKIVELTEDGLSIIDEELADKPWHDVRRAEYLLSWVGV